MRKIRFLPGTNVFGSEPGSWAILAVLSNRAPAPISLKKSSAIILRSILFISAIDIGNYALNEPHNAKNFSSLCGELIQDNSNALLADVFVGAIVAIFLPEEIAFATALLIMFGVSLAAGWVAGRLEELENFIGKEAVEGLEALNKDALHFIGEENPQLADTIHQWEQAEKQALSELWNSAYNELSAAANATGHAINSAMSAYGKAVAQNPMLAGGIEE